MQSLETDGFQPQGLDSQQYVKISCFICDAPAKAFIKQIKGYAGNCVQKGLSIGKMTFPLVDFHLRTGLMKCQMKNTM